MQEVRDSFKVWLCCPCGLQYPRLKPPEGWIERCIQRPCDECGGSGVDHVIFEDGKDPLIIFCTVCGGK